MATELLLGDEAVAVGAVHAAIAGAFSYPGTPATEVFECVVQWTRGAEAGASAGTERTGAVSARWSANEKVAYEEALGMSYAGRRALVSMKHVGLNVAADPFMNSGLTGVNAGLVLVVADDPGMHSSQNEQDSRYFGQFAQIPIFEPTNQQECYDMTRYAFEYSERIGLPVMIRLVTRLAHSRANVGLREPVDPATLAPRPRPDLTHWTLLPSNARKRFRRLLDMQPALQEESEKSAFNRLRLSGPRGIIAAGIAYNYVREALADDERFSLLKLGTYPLPAGLMRRLVDHCTEITVFEDGYPFIEKHLRGLWGLPGKTVRGRMSGELPPDGELTPDLVATALGCPAPQHAAAADDVAGRPPILCKGCPHVDTFKALMDATASYPDAILFSDIGCYTLGAAPPFRAVHSCVDMGASIAMAHGAAQAGVYPVLCTIGDSTFTHSGMTPLIGAAHADANMTVLVLDNAVVAMTGGQETLACGDKLVELIKGLGVDPRHLHVIDPVPKSHDEHVELIRRAIRHRGLSVIVAQRICIHVKPTVRAKGDDKQEALQTAGA